MAQALVKAAFAVRVRVCLQTFGARMRNIILFAVAILVVGGYAARFVDKTMKEVPQAAAVQQYEPRQPVHSGRSLTLDSGRGGHFQADARIAGRDIAFMVDTGASQVIMHESDAAKIGIR